MPPTQITAPRMWKARARVDSIMAGSQGWGWLAPTIAEAMIQLSRALIKSRLASNQWRMSAMPPIATKFCDAAK